MLPISPTKNNNGQAIKAKRKKTGSSAKPIFFQNPGPKRKINNPYTKLCKITQAGNPEEENPINNRNVLRLPFILDLNVSTINNIPNIKKIIPRMASEGKNPLFSIIFSDIKK
jgi:hypothetical protein